MNLHDSLVAIAAQQDYLWALVILAWLAAAVLHFRAPGGITGPSWIPGVALGATLFAALELSLLATPVDPRPYILWRIPWDAALGCVTFATAAVLAWSCAGSRRARLGVGLAVLLLLGLVIYGTRHVHPWGWGAGPAPMDERVRAPLVIPVAEIAAWSSTLWARITAATHVLGGLPLHLLLLLAGMVRGRAAVHRPERAALFCLVAGFWISSAGPLADLLHQPRAGTDLSLLGPWSAALLALGGIAVLRGQLGAMLDRRGDPADEMRKELRQVGLWIGLWLAAGGGLAATMGWLARRQFETGAIGRVRAMVPLIDTELVRRELGPEFRLDEIREKQLDTGRTYVSGYSRHLLEGDLRPVENRLAAIELANPDIRNASLITLRRGYLAGYVASARAPGDRDAVSLYRRASAADLAAWAGRAAFFLPPETFHFGEIAQAFAPLVTADGRMLGWLRFSFGSSTWRAPATHARMQVFFSVALGVGLFGLYFQLRWRGRQQQKLELAALAAKESDRAKTAFLAQVSHELRTPIQSIMGYGELLARQPLAPEARRWLDSIRSHGQLLTRLVNDLIDLSALQVGAFRLVPEPGNLAALVQAVVDSLQPRAAAKGLRIECLVAPELEATGLMFDTERMRQLLLNLAGNAVKFTAQGFVRIELAAGSGPGTVELRVRDTGPGISPAEQQLLFRPFSRLAAARHIEGAGLGLALTAGICAAMGGRLAVASDGRNGTVFTATLTLPPAELPDPAAAAAWQSLRHRRVLVADDNTLVRELFVTCLMAQGATCTAATDGQQALDLILADPPDVVVLDISMPGLDGLEVARRLRSRLTQPLRIVGVSAHADSAERARAMQAGMDAFLVKPVTLPSLVEAVAAASFVSGGVSAGPIRLEQLREIFTREAPWLRQEIQEAARAGDLERLHARIHYLKNSADIARYDELGLHCAQLETLLMGRTGRLEEVLAEVDRVLAVLGTEK